MDKPDYSLDNLPARALSAKLVYAKHYGRLEFEFNQRNVLRKREHVRAFAVCGMGRAGKDESAKWLCKRLGVEYPESLSTIVLPLVAHMVGRKKVEVFAERHDHRDFWIAACHAIRGPDYGCLVRWGLGHGDCAVGIRGKEEMATVRRERLAQLLIWIDNPRVPNDHTVEYGPDMCDLVIPNHGTLEDLYGRLEIIAPLIRSPIVS